MRKFLEQRSQRKTRRRGSFSLHRVDLSFVCRALLTPQSACGIFTFEADTLVFLPVRAGAGGSEMNMHYEDLRAPWVRRCLAPIACHSSQGHKGPAPEVFVGTIGGVAWGGSDRHASL